MTGQPVTGQPATSHGVAGSALLPQSREPDQADEVPVRQCGRCGGVGTHYLTCPALKLPPGYRISDPDRRAR